MLSESAIPWLVLEVSWSLVYVALLEGLGLLCYRRSPFSVDCLIGILVWLVEVILLELGMIRCLVLPRYSSKFVFDRISRRGIGSHLEKI